jgi:hypothetical protein
MRNAVAIRDYSRTLARRLGALLVTDLPILTLANPAALTADVLPGPAGRGISQGFWKRDTYMVLRLWRTLYTFTG